ncbi:maternal protein exuperantia-like [Saccostrea cucullata]|uniref:maternal protein exuperantia-like n=1 Tax=Saccostrea cuccullata TaxID=36930 RepID=UPI002ED6BC02
MPMTKAKEIIFDLETTGLARTSHILQIAAIKGEHNFNEYILPKAPIPPKVRELTGIRIEAKKMYHHDKEVKAVNITTGLTSFLDFLSSNNSTSVVLFGHNIKKFDVPVLFHALLSCGIMEKFVERVDGFVDTLPLFKLVEPGLSSYSQTNLFKHLLDEAYEAHDALQDVIALQRLLCHSNPTTADKVKNSFSLASTLERFLHCQQSKPCESSLSPLLHQKIITKRTASKIANSGLCFQHLQLAHTREGRQGIEDILKEQFRGKPRVTTSKRIIDAIADFFQNALAES